MIRKSFLLVACSVLALLVVPTTSAEAATVKGHRLACYGVKKKGNYNRVRLSLLGEVSNGKVAAYNSLSVAADCQRVNSLPLVSMSIVASGLKSASRVYASTGGVATSTMAFISRKTRFVAVPCGVAVYAYERVRYTYYDHTYVRPTYVRGYSFRRC